MIVNKIIEKVIGKLVLDLEFRQTLLQNPHLVLAQEGVSSEEMVGLLPHLEQLNKQLPNTITDNFMPTSAWND